MREKREMMYKMFRCFVSIKILLTYEVISFYSGKKKKKKDPDTLPWLHPLELYTFLVIDGIDPPIILAKSS